jgi:hypothetical protein
MADYKYNPKTGKDELVSAKGAGVDQGLADRAKAQDTTGLASKVKSAGAVSQKGKRPSSDFASVSEYSSYLRDPDGYEKSRAQQDALKR